MNYFLFRFVALFFFISTFVSCIGDEFLIETDDPETPADPVEEPISKIEAQDFIRKNKTDFFKADVEYVVFHQIEGVVFTSTNVDIIYHNHDANIHLYKNKEGEIQSFISSVYEVDYPGVDKTKGFSGIKFLWTTDGKIFAKQYYAYGKRVKDKAAAKKYIVETNKINLTSLYPDPASNQKKNLQ